ncbi:hypothetical protein E5D57_005653 [Metarhizium anisopliae]|nr:hypothetical protein E5D57_005653 [Metarhizium anisopliae]
MMDKETKTAERAKADKADKSDAKDRDKDHGTTTTNSKSPKKRRKVNHVGTRPPEEIERWPSSVEVPYQLLNIS